MTGNMRRAETGIRQVDRDKLSLFEKHTLPQIFLKQVDDLGSESIAVREKAYGIWQRYNWKDYYHYTKLTALGLRSLGLKRGGHVGLVLDNHPEFRLVDPREFLPENAENLIEDLCFCPRPSASIDGFFAARLERRS